MNPITERIIGCAIEVHRIFRCGLFESLYRSALAIEFDNARLKYGREASSSRSGASNGWIRSSTRS
jgi:GxxExxY protein